MRSALLPGGASSSTLALGSLPSSAHNRTLGGGPTLPWGGPGGEKEGKLGIWNYIKQAARHNYVPRRTLGFGVGQVPPVGPRIRTTMIWEPGLDRTVGNYKWLDVSDVLRKASYKTKAGRTLSSAFTVWLVAHIVTLSVG